MSEFSHSNSVRRLLPDRCNLFWSLSWQVGLINKHHVVPLYHMYGAASTTGSLEILTPLDGVL